MKKNDTQTKNMHFFNISVKRIFIWSSQIRVVLKKKSIGRRISHLSLKKSLEIGGIYARVNHEPTYQVTRPKSVSFFISILMSFITFFPGFFGIFILEYNTCEYSLIRINQNLRSMTSYIEYKILIEPYERLIRKKLFKKS